MVGVCVAAIDVDIPTQKRRLFCAGRCRRNCVEGTFFSSYIFIPWKYVQRIDYLVFEINFMLKETAQVVCLATSGLTEDETELLKQSISDFIQERLEEQEHDI